MNNENEDKKIVGYDSQTGEPIYETAPVVEELQTKEEPAMVEEKEATTEPEIVAAPIEPAPQPTIQPVTTEPKKGGNKALIFIIIGVVLLMFIVGGIALFSTISAMIYGNKSTKPNNGTYDTTESTFYGEAYTIKYKYPWSETTKKLTTGDSAKVLTYNNGEIYLLPIGNSDLSKTTTAVFSTSSGKQQLYKEFYDYWGTTNTLGSGTSTFYTLEGDVYYAYMDSKGSGSTPDGKLYIIVSESNNIVLSFRTYAYINQSEANNLVLDLFKNMNLNTIYDDNLSEYMDTMSNWNLYKSARSGKLGTKKTIEGGWRVLSSGESYWTFKDGKYYWYKSFNDLNDNYWVGTYKMYTGKTGLSKVGLSESRVDEITARNKNIKETDIYTLILTPSKVIVDGVDKSSTNITGGDWHMVWILIDHGSEGIEGQMLNVKTAEADYFVKYND